MFHEIVCFKYSVGQEGFVLIKLVNSYYLLRECWQFYWDLCFGKASASFIQCSVDKIFYFGSVQGILNRNIWNMCDGLPKHP